MKQIISTKYLSLLIFLLSIVVFIKLIWLVVSVLFLPNIGEEFEQSNKAKKLYLRVRLTNEAASIVLTPEEIAKQAALASSNKISSMRGYKLLGLYNSKKKLVVTVAKGSKTTILERGEKVNGFELISANSNFVMFKKNGKEFELTLENKTNSKKVRASNSSKRVAPKSTQIREEGGIKHIPKTLLTSYTKDMDKIWKDIGLSQNKVNGRASGFKVNFVKKGSDMEKLGIQRGDVLTAINGDTLNLSSAMSFFNNINNLENLTLTVDRNGKSEDLEYEIQ